MRVWCGSLKRPVYPCIQTTTVPDGVPVARITTPSCSIRSSVVIQTISSVQSGKIRPPLSGGPCAEACQFVHLLGDALVQSSKNAVVLIVNGAHRRVGADCTAHMHPLLGERCEVAEQSNAIAGKKGVSQGRTNRPFDAFQAVSGYIADELSPQRAPRATAC